MCRNVNGVLMPSRNSSVQVSSTSFLSSLLHRILSLQMRSSGKNTTQRNWLPPTKVENHTDRCWSTKAQMIHLKTSNSAQTSSPTPAKTPRSPLTYGCKKAMIMVTILSWHFSRIISSTTRRNWRIKWVKVKRTVIFFKTIDWLIDWGWSKE